MFLTVPAVLHVIYTLFNEHFRAGKLFLVGVVINHVPRQPVSAFLIVPPDSTSTIYNGASCLLASPLSGVCTSLILCIRHSGKATSAGLSAGRLASEQAPDVLGGRGRGGAWHSTGRLASEQAASN
jgi:hypothetical protein